MRHHTMDVRPVTENRPIYINGAELVDDTVMGYADNRQSADDIIRKLNTIVSTYGEADEGNEFHFSMDVS